MAALIENPEIQFVKEAGGCLPLDPVMALKWKTVRCDMCVMQSLSQQDSLDAKTIVLYL